MAVNLVEVPDYVRNARLYHTIFDDFYGDDTTKWTTTASDSGAAAVEDAAGGVLSLGPSDTDVGDNDEIYKLSDGEAFLFAAAKPIVAECRLRFAEANTDDANIAFGFCNAVAANTLQDNGAGPPSSYSGAVFFKQDGETVWTVENSLSTTQTTTQLTAANSLTGAAATAATAAGTWWTLRIEWQPVSSTKGDFLFYGSTDGRNDVLLAKHSEVTYTSATEMQLFVGVKNGGTNEETLYVDYLWATQKR